MGHSNFEYRGHPVRSLHSCHVRATRFLTTERGVRRQRPPLFEPSQDTRQAVKPRREFRGSEAISCQRTRDSHAHTNVMELDVIRIGPGRSGRGVAVESPPPTRLVCEGTRSAPWQGLQFCSADGLPPEIVQRSTTGHVKHARAKWSSQTAGRIRLWLLHFWSRKACAGKMEQPKPDSTSRLIASVSSASIVTLGDTSNPLKNWSITWRTLLRLGYRRKEASASSETCIERMRLPRTFLAEGLSTSSSSSKSGMIFRSSSGTGREIKPRS